MQERLPFDASRITPPPAPALPALLSVRQVNELVRGAIARQIPLTIHVLGEIGDLSRPTSGHLYFTLKDPYSELRCVMWRSVASQLRFAPEPGMEVIATGGLEVYTPRGTYQLIVRRLEPRGVGALEVAFRQLKERLEREGLFDARRKRPLPRIPQRIAVVTSIAGAALRDILRTLERRLPMVEVLVYGVRVQGEGAAQEIAAAIGALNEHRDDLGGIDLMIVGRGGGSLEDLWAFNEEIVARAIAASQIPVVSAVGHEIDVTISDLVADLRAPTPTAAAELIAPSRDELRSSLERYVQRATRALTHGLQLRRAELNAKCSTAALTRPLTPVREGGQLLDELLQRLQQARETLFRAARERWAAANLALMRLRRGAALAGAARQLDQHLRRLAFALSARRVHAERRLAWAATTLERVNPRTRVREYRTHLEAVPERMCAALRRALEHRRQLLEVRLQAAAAASPRAVLARGYSITRDAATRRVIRSTHQVRDGLRILTEVSDGEFCATAEAPSLPA